MKISNFKFQISNYPIIILHGWARHISGKSYNELKVLFEKKGFKVHTPDLPGFGKEPISKSSFKLDDYVKFVELFMKKNNIKKAILIGHSFGGRIAAKLAYKNPKLVHKLILTGAPLIKHNLSFKKKLVRSVARISSKTLSKLSERSKNILRKFLYFGIGEWDYYRAGNLKKTFRNIIAEDLSLTLPKIKVPSVVIWGENDSVVPLSDGKEIANRIPNAQFIAIPNTTHKLPCENPKAFFDAIKTFL